MALSNRTARGRRSLILVAVIIAHLAVVLLAVRTGRQRSFPAIDTMPPLILLTLTGSPRTESTPASARSAPRVATAARRPRAAETHASVPAETNLPEANSPEAPPAPAIDWEEEAHRAVQNFELDAEKQKRFRNLAGLSAQQLDWIKRNHMEPMPAGVEWHHHRVQFDKDSGLPVIWINDNCVIVAPLMIMVFCRIGHIEANGGLFNHMRDPHDP
jgi:hypothetical protein